MSHDAASMASMEDPSEGLGEVVSRVENAGDVFHEDVTTFFPVLNSEVLDVDVTRALCRDLVVDHVDGRKVVLVERSR